ncbi:MAG: hypothetical protein AW12_02744 [Candidatus Accumulibacter sp. BA-94]|nr:MAG: hypothetical protein AW12_02744 [Candidatus Accumulibacter sp. BA-94]
MIDLVDENDDQARPGRNLAVALAFPATIPVVDGRVAPALQKIAVAPHAVAADDQCDHDDCTPHTSRMEGFAGIAVSPPVSR